MEIYIGIILIISFITLVIYYSDKQKAIKNKWRIPEKVLLLLSFLGGALGGTIAMNVFRHKNKHWYFVVVNIGSLILHIVIGYYLYRSIGFIFI